MIALVPVRGGDLPLGGAEVVAECGGRALLVGEGAAAAASQLTGITPRVLAWDTPGFAPAAWAATLAVVLAGEPHVVLPASPDGRDLAPRLAAATDRPLHAGAVAASASHVSLARRGGLVIEDVEVHGPYVATLQPGVRGVDVAPGAPATEAEVLTLVPAAGVADAVVERVDPPDAATIDLAEAHRILGGGAGLDGPSRFEQLATIAAALGASVGATRVITDKGWISHSRQIGTTGVVVDPRLYVAFGISGAVQHTTGLGHPDHVISVNTDAHCPMMAMADLAVVSDANAVLDELVALLSSGHDAGGAAAGGQR